MGFRSENKQGYYGFVLCMYESSLLCRDVYLMPRTKLGIDTMLKYIINNTMCYIMLYMLEWMWKRKYRIET